MRPLWLVVGAVMVTCALTGCAREAARRALPGEPVVLREGGGADQTFTPVLAPYRVEADLSNVTNAGQFGQLSPGQKALLARNAFFVAPSPGGDRQLFWVYHNNYYNSLPSFVSCDTVLQLHHLCFDYLLRAMEQRQLIPICRKLTAHMYRESLRTWQAASQPEVKRAALKTVAYFAVAMHLLGMDPAGLPAAAASMASRELSLITAHAGRADSAIFPYQLEYSQFVPRGHYGLHQGMKRYFMAMMWYGLVPLALEHEGRLMPEQVRQGLLITRILYETKMGDKPALAAWERIYEPTSLLVETADDLTPAQYRQAAIAVYGRLPAPDELADAGKLAAFKDACMRFPAPRIADDPQTLGIPVGRQFRFMGQRRVPDAMALQLVVFSRVGTLEHGRGIPSGLDVMAALGSARAYHWLDEALQAPRYLNYDRQLAKARQIFALDSEQAWQRTLYWGWLWALQALLAEPGEGYPSFMRNEAWLDKSLSTALASWSELRHDTMLYAKQSMAAEGGDGPPPRALGYVEPQPVLHHRLLLMTARARRELEARDLLPEGFGEAMQGMAELLAFLREVSVKELENRPLSKGEYDRIHEIGSELEHLTNQLSSALSATHPDLITEADEDMALVADVHTDLRTRLALHEGVGHASHIYVVAPVASKLTLTRGAVFTHYEFTRPVSDRLSDERWQEMLAQGQAPALPPWTATFMSKEELKRRD